MKRGEPTTVDGVDSAPEKLEIHLKFKLIKVRLLKFSVSREEDKDKTHVGEITEM